MAKRADGLSTQTPDSKPDHEVPTAPKPAASPALTRSTVYRRLPANVRSRLDRALLIRPSGCSTLQTIADKFELRNQYGISPAALRSYARTLEQLVRPAMMSQLVASALGCLPDGYRERLVAGSEVLLLSRLVQALDPDSTSHGTGLPVQDLARLSSALTALARRGRRAQDRPKGASNASRGDPDQRTPRPAVTASFPEVIRELYGLSGPRPGENEQEQQ